MLRSKRIVFLMAGLLFAFVAPSSAKMTKQADFSEDILSSMTASSSETVSSLHLRTDSLGNEDILPARRYIGNSATPDQKERVEKIPILMYHSISDNPGNLLCLSPQRFAEQMRHLRNAGYHALTFADLEAWEQGKPIPVKPVLITLDDGYRDNYTAAFPILKQEQLKATIFLTVGFLNGQNSLTEEMANEMTNSGLVQFGSHSLSHMDLTQLPSDRLRQEVADSKRELEAKFGEPVTAFCYPSGRYTQQVEEEVKQAGYRFAVTTRPGWAEASQGMLTLHRVRINGDMTLDRFQELLP